MPIKLAEAVSLPLEIRVKMAHALVAVVAEKYGLDVLHMKGYAAPSDFYHANRTSTDADILIRPGQANSLISILRGYGWNLVTSFKSGSIFHHAAALWHETWGYIDVHRSFPGVGLDEDSSFERFWSQRESKLIAHTKCNVPNRLDHALLISIHAARDPQRGQADIRHLRQALAEDWPAVEARSFEFEARTPFVLATSFGSEHSQIASNPEYKMWLSLSQGSDRITLLRGRLEAAGSMSERFKILFGSLVVNRDHLRMKLGKTPTPRDFITEFTNRVKEPLQLIAHVLMKRIKNG